MTAKTRNSLENNAHCAVQRLLRQYCLNCIIVATVLWILGSLVSVEAAKAAENTKLSKIRCTKDAHGNNNCTCPDEPITERYVDQEAKHCEYFYLCHLGRAIKLECGLFQVFHPQLKECLPQDRVPKNVCPPLVDCPVRPNRYVEDPKDCTKFYLCYYGKAFHWTCPENQYFEPEKEKCINDRGQAEACVLLAKKNHAQNLGYEKPPPKTAIALTAGKKYRQELGKRKKG